ncbi:MAG: hypothetical protein ACI9FR_000265 [Cryomorphaceae bacterium]|jgi:hypothetical protein
MSKTLTRSYTDYLLCSISPSYCGGEMRGRHFSLSKVVVALGSALIMISGNAYAQQIAFLDSGVDPTRGFNVVDGFNYITNTDDTSDVSTREGEGHGTVSVRVASEAFSGEIVPFVITDGSLDRLNFEAVRGARDSALSDILGRPDVRVVGITWGTRGVVGAAAPLMSDLSAANKVIAIMAGNEVSAQPNTLASSSFNLSGVIIVGATDGEGVLLPESNRAGTTANKYVAAIGLPSSDATLGGASWAAARIAGIAGAVLLQNPDLTAAEVVNVILESAEDRGEAGVDSEYGRGVILTAAQVLNNVIGPVTVPITPTTPATSSGGGGGGGGAGLLLGGALVGALLLMKKPSAKLEKTLVLDSYGRTFQLDLGKQIVVDDGVLHLNQFFSSLDRKYVSNGFVIPKLSTEVAFAAIGEADNRLDMIEYFAMPGDVVIENERADFSMAVASKLTTQIGFTAGYRVNANQEFGAAKNLDTDQEFGKSSFISGQSFGSVLSGFSPQAETVSLGYTPKRVKNASLKLGLVSVNEEHRFGQDTLSTLLEGHYQFTDNAGLSMQFGQIEENGSLFGGAAGGIFGVDSATTYAVNVAGHIKVSDKISVVTNYGIGRTNVDSSEQSLLNDFSSLKSDWYSVGLIANDIFRGKDQLGLAFSQPLKIRDGEVNYSIPTGRNVFGRIDFDTERVSLDETNATETNLEAYYRTMLSSNLEIGGFASYRKNPNHVNDHGDEALAMLTVRYWQ